MSKVRIATVSLSSTTMADLKEKINFFLEETKGDGREYVVGEVYNPTPGYMAVDIIVNLDATQIQKHRALESFNNEEIKAEKIH